MRRYLALTMVAVAALAAGCTSPVASGSSAQPSSASSTPPRSSAASPPPTMTAAQLLTAAEVTDSDLQADADLAGKGVQSTFDQDHVPNSRYGVLTACGEHPASSTVDAAKVKAHVRAWITDWGLVSQQVYVLPKQTAKVVLTNVTTLLARCKGFTDTGVSYRKVARHHVVLPAAFDGSVAACFLGSKSEATCFAYLGRGHVATLVSSEGANQKDAEWQLAKIMAAAAKRLLRLPL